MVRGYSMLNKILSSKKLKLLYNKYSDNYIDGIDYDNLISIYSLFKKYNFYYIDDILVNYLEIFEKDYDYVEEKILELRKDLGNDFVFIIGNDMRYLEKI